jgi:hypothetical protein
MQKVLLSVVFIVTIIHAANTQEDSVKVMTDSVLIAPVADTTTVVPATPGTKKLPVYKLKPAIDIPFTVAGVGWCGYAFTKIYSKDGLTMEELQRLNPNNVPRFDRGSVDQYNESVVKWGDYLFYGSMPLPVLFLADNKMRKDFPKLALLYLEAMSVTGVPYTASVYFADRYRPYAYNEDAPLDFRMGGGARNSFFAGHPALVGTSTFFMATVYADYHPSLATAATLTTSVVRYIGGRHFLSDLIIGTTLGPAAGILVPKWHRTNKGKKTTTMILPYAGQTNGVSLIHKF